MMMRRITERRRVGVYYGRSRVCPIHTIFHSNPSFRDDYMTNKKVKHWDEEESEGADGGSSSDEDE